MRRFVNFWSRLLNSKDASADSLIFAGIVALFFMCSLSAYDVIFEKRPFNAFTFSTGAATIIAAVSGGKTVRDRWSARDVKGPSDGVSS